VRTKPGQCEHALIETVNKVLRQKKGKGILQCVKGFSVRHIDSLIASARKPLDPEEDRQESLRSLSVIPPFEKPGQLPHKPRLSKDDGLLTGLGGRGI
jgi:hypothetical protein